MMEELTGKELAEAKRQARRIRVRNIRRRISYGAAMLVAVFSGLALFRSLDQQAVQTTTAAVSTRTEDGESSLTDQVTSLFTEDGEGDEGEEGDDGSSSTSSSASTSTYTPAPAPTPSPAPLTTSQS